MAVPCRSWRLFHCIFWSHCCVWSAVSLNFRGAHMHFIRCMNISWIYEVLGEFLSRQREWLKTGSKVLETSSVAFQRVCRIPRELCNVQTVSIRCSFQFVKHLAMKLIKSIRLHPQSKATKDIYFHCLTSVRTPGSHTNSPGVLVQVNVPSSICNKQHNTCNPFVRTRRFSCFNTKAWFIKCTFGYIILFVMFEQRILHHQ